jgi:O-antigen/teichoic acid export membrane protein
MQSDVKTAEVARKSARSSLLLTSGNLLQAVILAIVSFIIARLLGPQDYGIYSLALTPPLLFSIFVDLGAVYSIQRNAAYYISKGEISTARRMTRNAILFTLLTGSILALVSFSAASLLASTLLHRPSLTPYIEIASAVVLAQAIFVAATTAFLGWGSPGYTGGLNVLYSILKLGLITPLIVLGFGVVGAVVGYTSSYIVAAVIGLTAIYLAKLRVGITKERIGTEGAPKVPLSEFYPASGGKESMSSISYFVADVREILRFGIPAYIGGGVFNFAINSFVLIVLSAFVSNEVVGYYQAAYNIITPISIVSMALGFSLFTAFASLDGMKADLNRPFKFSVTYSSLFLMPLVFFAIGASKAVVVVLYGSSYAPASATLILLALYLLPGAFGPAIFAAFFNGIGRTRLTLVFQLGASAIVFILAPTFGFLGLGLDGVIYSLIASGVVQAIVGTYLVMHYTHTHMEFQGVVRIFFASGLCFLAIFFVQSVIHLSPLTTLGVDLLVFLALYLTLIPALRAITVFDVERLEVSTGSLGPLRKPVRLIFRYETFMIKKTSPRKED